MSKADELKAKNENLFERNTVLINENERLQREVDYQKTEFESTVNNIPLVVNPCKMCKKCDKDGLTHTEHFEECKECCWFYDSKFEVAK